MSYVPGKPGARPEIDLMAKDADYQRRIQDPYGGGLDRWPARIGLLLGLIVCLVVLMETGSLLLGVLTAVGLALLAWLGSKLIQKLRRGKKK